MMLVGARGQQVQDFLFDASGATVGSGPLLVLPQARQRSSLLLQNISASPLYFEWGSARATATLTNGVVSSIAIANPGFGFTYPPIVQFLGGGQGGNSRFLGCGQFGYDAPTYPGRPATGQCVMTGSAGALSVASITINDGGSGYKSAPYIWITNDPNDPFGCADPSANSGTGVLLTSGGGSLYSNGTVTTIDAIAVYGASSGLRFTCKYSP